MCATGFPWTWFMVDWVYFVALFAGTMVLRARGAGPTTWLLFGLVSFVAGAVAFTGTFTAGELLGSAVAEGVGAAGGSGGAC